MNSTFHVVSSLIATCLIYHNNQNASLVAMTVVLYLPDTSLELTFKIFIKTSRIYLACLMNLYSNEMDLHCFSSHADFQIVSNLFHVTFKFISHLLRSVSNSPKIYCKFASNLFRSSLQISEAAACRCFARQVFLDFTELRGIQLIVLESSHSSPY